MPCSFRHADSITAARSRHRPPCVWFSFDSLAFIRLELFACLKSFGIQPARPGPPICLRYELVRVRLTRKLADALNGIDLKRYVVGEVLNLPEHFARMLIAEGWAELVDEPLAAAADAPRRKRR